MGPSHLLSHCTCRPAGPPHLPPHCTCWPAGPPRVPPCTSRAASPPRLPHHCTHRPAGPPSLPPHCTLVGQWAHFTFYPTAPVGQRALHASHPAAPVGQRALHASHSTASLSASRPSSPPVSAAAGVEGGPGSNGASPAPQCPCAAILSGESRARPVLGRWEQSSFPKVLSLLIHWGPRCPAAATSTSAQGSGSLCPQLWLTAQPTARNDYYGRHPVLGSSSLLTPKIC